MKSVFRMFGAWVIVATLLVIHVRAQSGLPMPPIPQGEILNFWPLDSSNWLSGRDFGPTFYTNLTLIPSWNNYSLQMDDTNPSALIYNITDTNSEGLPETNISFTRGSVEVWFSPDWNSADDLGSWGTLLEAGNWNTNLTTNSSAWGLYFSRDSSSLNFSAQGGGIATNYLSVPISWNSGEWHQIVLTYDATNTNVSLYLEGELVTNVAVSITNPPGTNVLTFAVGSDGNGTGMRQMRGEAADLWTYNYAVDSNSIADDYAYMAEEEVYPLPTIGFSPGGGGPADDTPDPGGGGSGLATNSDFTFATNGLWLNPLTLVSNIASIALMNSAADVLYEIQTIGDLTQTNWVSAGFVYGSELSNWTALNLPQSSSSNLFARARSWADTTGTGIPDWWWLQYFGQTTNVNAYTNDPAGDGYTDLQKFQFGIAPDTYLNTNPPAGFFGCLDATGTNVFLEWSPSPGPVTNYQVQRGILDTNGNYDYAVIGNVNSNATYFEDAGAISNANAWNNIYTVVAQYPAGIVTPADTWYASYGEFYNAGVPYGAPFPGNVYAYAQAGGTNVVVSWTAAAPGAAPTNYVVLRGTLDTNTFEYTYSPAGSVATNVNYFPDVIRSNNDWNNIYEIEAQFPGGVLSAPAAASASISTNAPGPVNLAVAIDVTGTNVEITWTPPAGMAVSNYVIERGVFNTNTDTYSYSQIGTVSSNTTSFQDTGAITGNNSYNNVYGVGTVLFGGGASLFSLFDLPGPPPVPPSNLYITANLIRNQTGRWQVMFSGLPTNTIQNIQLTWMDIYFASTLSTTNISSTNVSNGVYLISDTDAVANLGNLLGVQLLDDAGNPGPMATAGILSHDAPYFVDGRQHLAESLQFLLRSAGLSQTYSTISGEYRSVETPNFVETSFLHPDITLDLGGDAYLPYVALDNLWPFTLDYELFGALFQSNTFPAPFSWQTNFTTIPAPPELTMPDPYWIALAPNEWINAFFGSGPSVSSSIPIEAMNAWGMSLTNDYLSLETGQNLYGLAFQPAMLYWSTDELLLSFTQVSPGSEVLLSNFYGVLTPYTQTTAPDLQTVGYYFVPVVSPGVSLPSSYNTNQIAPLPMDSTFAVTNQTPLIVGTVGQPMLIGGWAKQAISNGASGKFGYLGQYFETNAYLLATNGSVTTNSAGIVSPYGDFFPMQAGIAEMTTMTDTNTGTQGTNYVRVISLCGDANHDGILDPTFAGPDFTSSSRPLRFWVDDSQDSGDFGGTGVPGQGSQGNGLQKINGQYVIHGRRDLVNLFPVYLNIGSLFQSNALSAGISVTDTNWQLVLSQSDGVLRFTTTDLTPTNYMNFLRDTNESGNLANAALTTISNSGVALSPSFIAGIATNNQGIILVQAAAATTQPLVLSIYHGTNQIAQTSLYLSISGVEQMFRYKNLLVGAGASQAGLLPDRLTDADVPNEPDTIGKNVVFVHGYNVSPTSARGWFADVYKRLYWSGCHAKFYGVNWYGNDSQGALIPGVTANYQTNVVHAFQTAPLLANFVATLTNGPTVVLAHSLGNMVALSALSDYSAPMSQYFMLDAAVPMEAIDPGTPINTNMVFSTLTYGWQAYSNRLWASEWFNLWPTNDARSTLSWNGRLDNFGSTAVYDFYSSGEEVLRTHVGPPPGNLFSLFGAQLVQWIEGQSGTYVWAWQEKDKGRMSGNTILSSDHGGWGFFGISSIYTTYTVAMANAIPPSQLQTNAFFDMSVDTALFTTSSSGSSYAQANRNRILSDAIPAVTLPIGANPVTDPGIVALNFDMKANENGWPLGRLEQSEGANWHHSDIRVVAYPFTYKVFNEIVNDGGLK